MKTGVRGIHPVSAVLFFSAVLLVELLTLNPAIIIIGFFSALFLDFRLRGKSSLKTLFSFLLPMALSVALFNALFAHYGVTVLFELRSGNAVTLEATVCGVVYGFRTMNAILWLYCFNEIVTQEKYIYLFGSVAPRLSLVTSMVLRFIPLLSKRASEIEKARRGIGIDSKSGSLLKRVKNASHSVSILVSWSLERAADTAASMTSRGYSSGKRTNCLKYSVRAFDIVLSVLSVFASALSVIFKKSLSAEFNPVIYFEKPTFRSVFTCAVFLAACVLPLIFDFWEARLWSTSKRKI